MHQEHQVIFNKKPDRSGAVSLWTILVTDPEKRRMRSLHLERLGVAWDEDEADEVLAAASPSYRRTSDWEIDDLGEVPIVWARVEMTTTN